MNLFPGLEQGLAIATSALNLNMVLIGVLLGSLIGCLPSLRTIHGVAVFLPVAYAISLPIESTLILLLAIYLAAEFSSNYSAPTINRKKADTARQWFPSLPTISSFCGGLTAVAGLMMVFYAMRQVAVLFGPAEYFVLVIFAFASLSVRAGEYPLRALGSTCLGLMLATVGIDSTTGVLRYTFDEPQLYDGIEFTTVVVGLFVVSEIFIWLEKSERPKATFTNPLAESLGWPSIVADRWVLLRASLVGFLTGVLPGVGASTASYFAVKLERSLVNSKTATQVGSLREAIARETANSASIGGAMVLLLVLGIPGSGTTAILLGTLLLYNITPGPGMVVQHSELIWAIIVSMLFGNLLLLPLNMLFRRLFCRFQKIPDWVLAPGLIALAFVGVFSVNQSSLSLIILILLGFFAYQMTRWHFSLVLMLVGFVLGELMEDNLRRALAISGGDLHILYASLSSKILWTLIVFVILLPLLIQRRTDRKTAENLVER